MMPAHPLETFWDQKGYLEPEMFLSLGDLELLGPLKFKMIVLPIMERESFHE